MTKEQAQVANNRIMVLEDRIQNFTDNIIHWGIDQEKDSSLYINLATTMTEFQLEIKTLKYAINTRYEWLFNFAGGGWNSVNAYTREEAIALAKDVYSGMEIDEKTFRISTTSDKTSLLRNFY